jgi:hypothetical protein
MIATIVPANRPEIDASSLLAPYTRQRIEIRLDPRLRAVDLAAEASRIALVLHGFARLERPPAHFAMIGPGSGVEAIGAGHIFRNLRRITVIDRDPAILAQAATNIRANIGAAIEVEAQSRNIWAPLARASLAADLLYADLSNLPVTDAVSGRTAVDPPIGRNASTVMLKRHLLGLQCCFLRRVLAALRPGGSVLVLLGGRVDDDLFEILAAASGVRLEEVVCGLLQQSDAWNVVGAHAAAEAESTVAFDFYDFEAARHALPNDRSLSGPDLRAALAPWRLSASTAASELCCGMKIGHTAHLMKASAIE